MSKETAAGDRPAPDGGAGTPEQNAVEKKTEEEYKNSGGCLQLLILAVVVGGLLIGAVLMFGDFAK